MGSAQKAWLGSAVAIKEPTAASFARHAGSNLLVVGTWEESALGVLANALISLAAQNKPERAGASPPPSEGAARSKAEPQANTPFTKDTELTADGPQLGAEDGPTRSNAFAYILDGTRPESPEAGTWQKITDALPHRIDVGTPRDTARIMNEIAAELTRREAASDEDSPPIYLVIFNGGRFRDLRRGDDDFSFSMDRDKPASPEKQWAEVLKNGPAWGIHSLVWCDSYNNVNRILDRLAMREFEMRVAFQMSAADSSSLLDNPAATKLRQHRGLFASEDLGTLEKFRPYGIPTDAWLAEVRKTVNRL
jgi:hypothetical protein